MTEPFVVEEVTARLRALRRRARAGRSPGHPARAGLAGNGGSNLVDAHIRRLRAKIEQEPAWS